MLVRWRAFWLDWRRIYGYNIAMKKTAPSALTAASKTPRRPMEIHLTGYEVVEKRANQAGTSGRIYVPRAWIGKLVRAVRVER